MTPDQIAKSGSESAHQMALFAFVAIAANHGFNEAWRWSECGQIANPIAHLNCLAVPELHWLHHIPNGGSRGDDAKSRAIRGGKLKAEGVKTGVADLFLPVKRGQWSGLYIEMKKPTEKPKKAGKGGVSEDQAEFGQFVQGQGFGWCVCYSWREAVEVLEKYLNF